MAPPPLISVIVPCYNQGAFLADSLQSVLEQTYSNWECLIVNDGSTDYTEAVAQEWVRKDTRFKYIYKTNGGLSSARNAGLKQAMGAYFQFLDADDCIGNTKFEQSMKLEADIVVSDYRMFTSNMAQSTPPFCKLSAAQLNYETVLAEWDKQFNIPIHCGFFSQKVLTDFVFNETLKAKEDWLMWIHVFGQSSGSVFIQEPLAFYRLHAQSMTTNRAHMRENLEKVYAYLYNELDSKGRAILYHKVLDLYMTEGKLFESMSIADIQDFIEISRGRKKLGIIGSVLFRTLRKVGHLADQNKKVD